MARSLLEDVPEQTFTEQTIRRMYRLVQQAVTDEKFQKLVYGLVNASMPGKWKDYRGELSTVLNWFKRNVDYRRDPHGVELLQDVWATLDRGRGDCDDATVWLCAAAQILGCPTRIVTVSTRPDKEPVHVYCEAMVGGRWLGLDATVPGSFVGWKPPHVTDTRIWTRKELGLSGDDDTSTVEGLGMTGDENWNQRDIYETEFRGTMTPVSDRLAPGVPDDVSKTDAPGIPGTTNITKRGIWRAPVANNSDWTSNPRPGGGVYGPALPLAKRPLPQDLWYLVDRKFVPKVLDPDSSWWGKVPTSREDLSRMFPGSEVNDMSYLRDIASVPASAIAEVEDDVRTQLALGEIGLADVGDAIQEGLEDYALGKPPRMKRPPGQRGPRTKVKGGGKEKKPHPAPPVDRRFMVPAPSKILIRRGGHLNGLGDVVSDAAAALAAGVKGGQVPPSTIEQAINSVASAITGQPQVTKMPDPGTPSAATVAKAAIPLGMIALLGLAALAMSGGGGKKYKRNPSRRRSRSRGRRGGGGFDVKTALLWGGGGLAAYYLLLRPGAPLMPSFTSTSTPVAPKPASGLSPTEQAAIAAGVKIAPSIFSWVKDLFGGGSSSTPAPSGMVTSYDQLFSSPSPSSSQTGTESMVFSL